LGSKGKGKGAGKQFGVDGQSKQVHGSQKSQLLNQRELQLLDKFNAMKDNLEYKPIGGAAQNGSEAGFYSDVNKSPVPR